MTTSHVMFLEKKKGWVLNALYCAFWALKKDKTFRESIDAVIQLGGDTDTNAAIAGSLLGAKVGFRAMESDEITAENLKILLAADYQTSQITTAGKEYHPSEIAGIAEKLAKLYQKSEKIEKSGKTFVIKSEEKSEKTKEKMGKKLIENTKKSPAKTRKIENSPKNVTSILGKHKREENSEGQKRKKQKIHE